MSSFLTRPSYAEPRTSTRFTIRQNKKEKEEGGGEGGVGGGADTVTKGVYVQKVQTLMNS